MEEVGVNCLPPLPPRSPPRPRGAEPPLPPPPPRPLPLPPLGVKAILNVYMSDCFVTVPNGFFDMVEMMCFFFFFLFGFPLAWQGTPRLPNVMPRTNYTTH